MERTDLIEMWGNFIGREYAHRRYGIIAYTTSFRFYLPFKNFTSSPRTNQADYR